MYRLIAALFGLAVCFVIAEIGIRLAGQWLSGPRLPLPYDYQTQFDQLAAGQVHIMFDRELGWLPRPGVNRLGSGVRYRHNQAGLRSEREHSTTPAPGFRRFSAYGDSYTYCDEGELEDCWTRRLEQMLPRSEVLNFGVPGYAVDQAWLRYEREHIWQACAVFIGHSTENISRVVNRFRPFYVPRTALALAKPRFVREADGLRLLPSPVQEIDDLRDPRWVEANLGPHDAWYFPGIFVPNPLDRARVVSLARTAVYLGRRGDQLSEGQWQRMYRPGAEAFEVLVAVMVEFAERVRANAAIPVVLIFPTRAEIVDARDGKLKSHASLTEALRERGIATVDLTDALGEEARRVEVAQLIHQHYRPAGNAVVASTLAKQLPSLSEATCRGATS